MIEIDKIEVVKMELSHLDEVYEIEQDSFSLPWSKSELKNEICNNKLSMYIVAIKDDVIAGYAGMWHVVTEGHITNVAVKYEYRRQGVGERLITELIRIGIEKEMIGLTLEVRMNNEAAQKLYHKFGFVIEGLRKNYYQDTKEDAIIMWKYFHLG